MIWKKQTFCVLKKIFYMLIVFFILSFSVYSYKKEKDSGPPYSYEEGFKAFQISRNNLINGYNSGDLKIEDVLNYIELMQKYIAPIDRMSSPEWQFQSNHMDGIISEILLKEMINKTKTEKTY